MCGIAGVLFKHQGSHEIGKTLIDMLDGCQHRGPDSTGFALYGETLSDQLRMRCGYDNPTNETVTAGLGTSDEMCFDFMVVTPAAAAAQCANF